MWPYPPQKNSFLLQFVNYFLKRKFVTEYPPFQKPVSPFGDFSWENKGLSNWRSAGPGIDVKLKEKKERKKV
jgi:hypothetical protein